VGIDLVEIGRIEESVKRWGEKFLNRIYLPTEIDYCSRHPFPPQHYAARFAAKEAFLKSLGIGIFRGVSFREVEVCVGETGRPELSLHGGARDLMRKKKITSVHLSLSHSVRYATAIVILE
jgi:holo-[acyl-carrier protein] synthase